MKKLVFILLIAVLAMPALASCKGDANGDGVVDLADLSSMVTLLGDNWQDQWTDSCLNSGYCDYYLNSGDPGFNAALDFNDNDTIDLADLSALVTLLSGYWWDQWTDSCWYGYCDYYYTCP